MSSVTCHISISLDGFVAGPNQSLENPIGEGGLKLHEWVFRTRSWRAQQGLAGGESGPDSEVADRVTRDVGAYIMGRNMFGGGDGRGTRPARAGGARTRPITRRRSCSATTPARR